MFVIFFFNMVCLGVFSMSMKLNGIDLNCDAVPIEANQEYGFVKSSINETLKCDPSDSVEFTMDGARVLGEVNDSSNTSGLVNEELKAKIDVVNRDERLEIEMEGVNCVSVSKDVPSAQETARNDGELDVEMRGVDGAVVEEKVEIDQNREMRVCELTQNSYKEPVISLVVDLNLSHEEGICNDGAEVPEEFIEVNLSSPIGLVGNMDASIQDSGRTTDKHAHVKEVMISGQFNEAVEKDVNPHALIPKQRGKDNQIEKEGEFYVSDLVWGKVRSHPWWPGQIIEPSAASEKAMKYFKKDSYLISYFGDQTFAWNEASKIKPFRMYFSQMKKQSNVEAFCHAVNDVLDEVSIRVEFGLACQCLPKEEHDKVKSRVVINAGVRGKSTAVCGGDSFSTAASFSPEKFVDYLKALAESPHSDYDDLEFIVARAQLLAFNRRKGYYQLPVFEELKGILGSDGDLHVSREDGNLDDVINGDGSSCMHKHDEFEGKKSKLLLDLMSRSSSSFPNGEGKFEGKSNSEKWFVSSSKKRKAVDSVSSERRGRRRRGNNAMRNYIKVGEDINAGEGKSCSRRSQRAVVAHGGKSVNASSSGASTLTLEKSQVRRAIPQEYPPMSEVLSKLCVAAISPMEGYHSLASIAGVLCDFRNSISLEYNNLKKKTTSLKKLEAEKLSSIETTEAFQFEGMEDSYWTDRIIQSNVDEQVLFEPETSAEKDIIAEQELLEDAKVNLKDKNEANAVVTELGTENPLLSMNENFDEYSPTTLILNFNDLESVPSITNLNQIFHRFGSLEESQTEVLSKSKRAKVVFKRRSDAETAFSSAGKFSIFGPSLVSYRLKYKPAPRRPSSASITKRSRKSATSIEVGAK